MSSDLPAPAGSVPFEENALEAGLRECDTIDSLVGLTTLTGERTRAATRAIRASLRELERRAAVTLGELEDCLAMAQARGED